MYTIQNVSANAFGVEHKLKHHDASLKVGI